MKLVEKRKTFFFYIFYFQFLNFVEHVFILKVFA